MDYNLIKGNSVNEIKAIEDNSIHAIISDIPYGISYESWDVLHNNQNKGLGGVSPAQVGNGVFQHRGKPLNGWSNADKMISTEYQEWCSKWAKEWLRVLKSGGSCFIFAGRRYAHRCVMALEEAGFTFKDMLCWEKNSSALKAQRLSCVYERRNDKFNAEKYINWRVGNLKPLFEPILWFQKPYKIGGTIASNMLKYGIGAWNEEALKNYNNRKSNEIISNIISVKACKDDKKYHPAQKPIKLIELLITLVTNEGDFILDPFMGSGTVGVACVNTNRSFVGIEIEDKYFNIAKKRIDETNANVKII